MAVRCSPDDVQAIIDYDPAIENLDPFIEAANELVTEICAPAVNGYSATRLKQIETWLAAHFLAVRDPRYASESMGQASASVQGQVGMNLSLTTYGQQAMLLDTKGGLARLDVHVAKGQRATVSITWLGNDDLSRPTGRDWLYQRLWSGF
jgi:hypothetical protein